MKNRYFIALSYHGSGFAGWQIQANALSVQAVLNQALSTICKEPISTTGCGRTDAGVHAREFFAHFDTTCLLPSLNNQPETSLAVYQARLRSVNALAGKNILVHAIWQMPASAHARFDATSRSYEYLCVDHENPFYAGLATKIKPGIDLAAMNSAANLLLGTQDFSCFSKLHTQVKTHICSISQAIWIEQKPGLFVFSITADRFLRNMVRAIVGTLLDIGMHKKPPEYIVSLIKSKDRGKASASISAGGLYLTAVTYPYNVPACASNLLF